MRLPYVLWCFWKEIRFGLVRLVRRKNAAGSFGLQGGAEANRASRIRLIDAQAVIPAPDGQIDRDNARRQTGEEFTGTPLSIDPGIARFRLTAIGAKLNGATLRLRSIADRRFQCRCDTGAARSRQTTF